MSDVEYWKQRAKLAEDTLERLQKNPGDLGNDASTFSEVESEQWTSEERDRYYDNTGLRSEALAALRLLMSARNEENETAEDVAKRLFDYCADRELALTTARRAGYPVLDNGLNRLVQTILRDLHSGRQTIEFLSRPPKLPADSLPVGAVFTTQDGRLLEVKRERVDTESLVTCYRWDRNVEPTTIDRKQLVQPLGRVVFNQQRKTIVLGLLELSQHALAQVVTEDAPKQLEPENPGSHRGITEE